ncbi:hypothetical protein ES705_29932 [subsurface metagenome]
MHGGVILEVFFVGCFTGFLLGVLAPDLLRFFRTPQSPDG